MLLSSYDRMRRYIGTDIQAKTDSRGLRQTLTNWITAVSNQVENYLNRSLESTSYTEYFDTLKSHWIQYYVKAHPITTLTDVYIDGDGKFDGGESEIEDCITGINSRCVVLPYSPPVLGYKTLRIRYTGGLATHGTQSVLTCSITGSWTVEYFALGGTSGAVGIVKATTATTITIEVLYGIFNSTETITEYSDEDITTATGNSAVVSSIQQALVELYPDIVRAAEAQVRYYWKHKDDFELSGTNKDGTNIRNTLRRATSTRIQPLTDEVISLLQPYKRIAI